MKKIFAFILLLTLSACACAEDYVPGDVIVVLRNNSDVSIRAAAESSGESSGGVKSLSSVQALEQSTKSNVKTTFDALSEQSGYVFMVIHSDTEDAKSLRRKAAANPNVIAASLNGYRHGYAETSATPRKIPNDPEYYQLWGMEAIKAPSAWTVSTGSDDIYAAVIDSGIDYTHPDLKDNFNETSLRLSRNFYSNDKRGYTPETYMDDNEHGTHVAGTIGARGNNGIGVAGVNWNVKLIALKSLDASNGGTDESCFAAVNHLIRILNENPTLKVAAVNYSIGGSRNFSPEDREAAQNIEYLAFKALSDMNRVVICISAGNETAEVGAPNYFADFDEINQGHYVYPPSFRGLDNAIVVAAAGSDLTRTYFSNYSRSYVDIAAPGLDIFSTLPTTLSVDMKYDTVNRTYPYGNMSGTSMAAPHVTGAAALLKSIYPNATPQQIKAAIVGGADTRVLCEDGTSMYGMLDIDEAIYALGRIMSTGASPQIAYAYPSVPIVNQPYKFQFYAAGSGKISWDIDGTLPAGLSFDKNSGVISGTPLSVDSTEIVITAMNDYGYDSLSFTYSTDKGTAPVIGSADVDDTSVGVSTGSYIRLKEGTWPFAWEILNRSDITADGSKVSLDKNGYITLEPKTAKTYTIKAGVSNFAGSDSIDIKVYVSSADQAFTIYGKTLKRAVVGRVYGMSVSSDFPATYNVNPYRMKAGDTISTDCPPKYTWTYEHLPEGLTLTENSGIFTITGTPEIAGSYDLVITVSNDYHKVSKDFMLYVVSDEPSFLEDKYEITYAKGLNMALRIPVLGTPSLTLGVSGDNIPGVDFLNETLTATFTGTPTTNGTYKTVITASNDYGFASADVIITVAEPSIIATSVLPDAVIGEKYSFRFSSYNNVPLSWKVSGDILARAGLTLSASGDLAGTPTRAGDYRFTVTAAATDGSVLKDTWNYLLHVSEKPSITNSTTLPSGKINTPYEPVYLAYNGTNPVWWTLSGDKMPIGLDMSSNGCIYGTPLQSGDFTFSAVAANLAGSDTRTFTIKITSSADPAPSPTPGPDSHDPTPTPTPTPGSDSKVIDNHGGPRGFSSLTQSERLTISAANEIIGAVLPSFDIKEAGLYTYQSNDIFARITLSSDVPAGYRLMWHAFTRTASGSFADEYIEDSANSEATFYDSEGNVIDTVPANRTVNVSVLFYETGTYYPVIAAKNSASDSIVSLGSSSGGCETGLSVLSLLLCAIFFRKNSR